VLRHQHGWAYRLEGTYSRVFSTQWEATDAARAEALRMHEPGDATQVRVQDGRMEVTKLRPDHERLGVVLPAGWQVERAGTRYRD
jgi:hypothetical protein